jgi:FlaA1/EpsC-like NDP-sugar epimerase
MILDMGEQKLVTKVAEELFPGYPQRFIGIKEGEKFEEELMTPKELLKAKKLGKFYII